MYNALSTLLGTYQYYHMPHFAYQDMQVPLDVSGQRTKPSVMHNLSFICSQWIEVCALSSALMHSVDCMFLKILVMFASKTQNKNVVM